MMDIWPISALGDNYIWVIESPSTRAMAVVDPGDAAPVKAAMRERGLGLAGILITHHHGDHTGGVAELVRGRDTPVYAPAGEGVRGTTNPVTEDDSVAVKGLDLELQVLTVPGHTRGHVAYLGDGFVLVGDTLFAGGCGRIFEGTAEQMYASLQRLAQLPPSTRVYCAHEYTVANLRFARQVEPGNADLTERLADSEAKRSNGLPTVPSTLAEELATNPFLRCSELEVVAAGGRFTGMPVQPGIETFAAIRKWKDGF